MKVLIDYWLRHQRVARRVGDQSPVQVPLEFVLALPCGNAVNVCSVASRVPILSRET